MKTAFITGGNRGIGRGFVEYLLSQGFQVFAGVRKPENVDPKLKANNNLVIVPLDVSNDESIKNATVLVGKKTDHLDILINNAGTNKDTATRGRKELVSTLSKLDRKCLLYMFNVNAISPMMVLKEFLFLLKGNPSFVINITSGRASYRDEYPNTSGNYGYRGSKAALNLMTFSSLIDLPKNVKTFAVHPGGIKTDMNPTGDMDAVTQAEKVINITKNWKEEFNGKFLRFNGVLYPL